MSIEHLGIEQVWNGLLRYEQNRRSNSLAVEGLATRVMLGLVKYVAADGEMTRINLSQIGRDVHLSREAMRSGLQRLSEAGIVRVETVRTGRPTNYCGYTEEFLEEVA